MLRYSLRCVCSPSRLRASQLVTSLHFAALDLILLRNGVLATSVCVRIFFLREQHHVATEIVVVFDVAEHLLHTTRGGYEGDATWSSSILSSNASFSIDCYNGYRVLLCSLAAVGVANCGTRSTLGAVSC